MYVVHHVLLSIGIALYIVCYWVIISSVDIIRAVERLGSETTSCVSSGM